LPTYEYVCTACGHDLEAVQKFSDDALTVCPDCGGALRKVFGAVGIVLKGSGFYKTDSRAPDKRASSNGDSAKSGDTGKETTKKDTSSSSSTSSESSFSGSGSGGSGSGGAGSGGSGSGGSGSGGSSSGSTPAKESKKESAPAAAAR
jgi:putative FmdB family regulatory protein